MARTLPPALSELEGDLGIPAGTLTDPDKTRAERALAKATTLVLAEVPPTVAERWSTDAPAVVELVVLTAARRGYENPRGVNQETLLGHTVGLSEATGVYLTGREVAQITRAAYGSSIARRKGFVGTIRTPSAYADADGAVDFYVPVADGSRPVPFLSVADIGGGV